MPTCGALTRALVPFLLLGALSGALGCSSKKEKKPGSSLITSAAADERQTVRFDAPALARLGVKVEAVGTAAGAPSLTFPGTLDYALDRYAEVGTLVEGRVSSVHVMTGDRVKRGQALAVIAVPALVEAQAQLSIAEASARIAEANAAREAALFDKSLTTARENEVARGDAAKGRAEVVAAQARLALLTGAPGTTVAGGKGNLTLVAPIDGTVVRRDLVLGGRIQPSETAFVVSDLSTLWATLNVFEADLRHVAAGSAAEITVEALPGRTFAGRVVVVEPHVSAASRVARARVVVANEDGALKPGLFFQARIRLEESALGGAVVVPRAAVQPLGGRDVVFVERAAGEYEIRGVRLGRVGSQVAEVADGLARGERIVTEGASLLRSEATKQ